MRRTCAISGIEFETTNRDEQVSPVTRELIIKSITSDKQLLKEVSAAILGDTEIMMEIAKALLAVDANDIGLSHPGNVGEFFLNIRDDLAATDT
jgi:archaellum component FlaG (FlaF/FlaG flagellin family)